MSTVVNVSWQCCNSNRTKCVSNQLGFSHFHSLPHIFARHIVGVSPYPMSQTVCLCAMYMQMHCILTNGAAYNQPMQSNIECSAGIIMANHFRNHARENVHHIILCSIMHVCSPILCASAYVILLLYMDCIAFARQTLYLLILQRHIVSCITNP